MEVERRATPYGPFPAGYLECPLIALCVPEGGVQTGPFGSQLHKRDYVEVGTPIITVEHLGDNRILHDATPKVSDVDRDRLSRYQLRPGDIVFSRVGSVDRRALVSEEEAGWLFSGRCLRVRPNSELIDPTYLSYFFGLETFKEYVRSIAVGATMPSINTAILSNVPVIFPPSIDEQQAIASILKALDDKIELNRRMCETLEDIAATVFHSWFVAFDGAEHLETSDLGLIPVGWHFEPIGNLIEVVGGSTPSTKEPSYWEGGQLPWATPKDLSGHEGPVLLKTARSITDAGLERISSGLLPKGTLLFSSRAPIGYRAIAGQPMAVNQGFIAVPPGGELSPTYMYFWTHSNLDVITGHAGGSTFAEISKRSFRSIPAVLPPMGLRHRFDEVAGVILRRCEILARESETLAELRDALLPKLISGELRISEAEQLVSEVAY